MARDPGPGRPPPAAPAARPRGGGRRGGLPARPRPARRRDGLRRPHRAPDRPRPPSPARAAPRRGVADRDDRRPCRTACAGCPATTPPGPSSAPPTSSRPGSPPTPASTARPTGRFASRCGCDRPATTRRWPGRRRSPPPGTSSPTPYGSATPRSTSTPTPARRSPCRSTGSTSSGSTSRPAPCWSGCSSCTPASTPSPGPPTPTSCRATSTTRGPRSSGRWPSPPPRPTGRSRSTTSASWPGTPAISRRPGPTTTRRCAPTRPTSRRSPAGPRWRRPAARSTRRPPTTAPPSPRQPQPATLVELGELLESQGRQAEAERQYAVVRATQQLYAASGQVVDVELALFEADHGDPAAAVRLAEKGLAARPDSVVAQDAYAWALHAAGRDAEALPLARSALRTGYRGARYRYHLGAIEAALGQTAAARARPAGRAGAQPVLEPAAGPQGPRAAGRARLMRRALVVAGLAAAALVGLAAGRLGAPARQLHRQHRRPAGGPRADRVDVQHVVDTAEIPTLQLTQSPDGPDADRDGTRQRPRARGVRRHAVQPGRRRRRAHPRRAAARRCASSCAAASVVPGQAGLPTSAARLHPRASARAPAVGGGVPRPDLDRSHRLEGDLRDRAVRRLTGTGGCPTQSPSALLTAYPQDLLTSPLDVTQPRSA